MKRICIVFLFLVQMIMQAQDGFVFNKGVYKTSIPINLINSLIFIPIKVNGVALNFLLDTGVEETILFSLEDNPEVKFYNSEKISLRGLGSEEAIDGLKTTNNILEVEGMKSTNQLMYVILDQNFNLSSHIGIPVNGIIGYQFFRNNLVGINYHRKKMVIYKNDENGLKKVTKKFKQIPITIEKYKPYLLGEASINAANIPVKLLIDTGNSDSIWLFQNLSDSIKVPSKNFEDFLGKGFSGDIEGKRARISRFTFNEFSFNNPIVAFPDSSSIKNVRMVQNRLGSIGGGILKRFFVFFDYKNEQLYLKKNSAYSDPFLYNKSGIEVKHNGLQWVQETVKMKTVPISGSITLDSEGERVMDNFKYKFELKPIYEIANIRKNSPAANCGLKVGDILIKINREKVYKYTLQQINEMFQSEGEKWIHLEVERNGQAMEFNFKLLDILEG